MTQKLDLTGFFFLFFVVSLLFCSYQKEKIVVSKRVGTETKRETNYGVRVVTVLLEQSRYAHKRKRKRF